MNCGGSSGGGGSAATPTATATATSTPTDTPTDSSHSQENANATYEFVNMVKGLTTYTPTATTMRIKMTYDSYDKEADQETYVFALTGTMAYSSAPYGNTITTLGCTSGTATFTVIYDSDRSTVHSDTADFNATNCILSDYQFSFDSDSTYTFTSTGLIVDQTSGATTYEYKFNKL
jgi:hypothetical protein